MRDEMPYICNKVHNYQQYYLHGYIYIYTNTILHLYDATVENETIPTVILSDKTYTKENKR